MQSHIIFNIKQTEDCCKYQPRLTRVHCESQASATLMLKWLPITVLEMMKKNRHGVQSPQLIGPQWWCWCQCVKPVTKDHWSIESRTDCTIHWETLQEIILVHEWMWYKHYQKKFMPVHTTLKEVKCRRKIREEERKKERETKKRKKGIPNIKCLLSS